MQPGPSIPMKLFSFKCSGRKVIYFTGSVSAVFFIIWLTLKHNSKVEPAHQVTALAVPAGTKRDRPPVSFQGLQTNDKLSNSVDWTKCSLSIKDTGNLARAPMTPALARILLQRVKSETKNINERACVSSAIIAILCRQGYTEEAWEIVDKNPGQLREFEIGAIFLSDLGPMSNLVNKLETLNDPNEKSEAFRSLITSRPTEILDFDFSKISVVSPQEKVGIAMGIISAMKNSDSLPGGVDTTESLLKKAVDLVKEHKLDPSNLTSILNYDYNIDVSNKWKILEGLKDGIAPNEVEQIYSNAVLKMINSDMNKTMDLICSTPSTKNSVPIISRAITAMYDADPEQANNWVTNHLPSLDPGTGQRIVVRVAQVAIKNGEFETAQQWTNRLLNPGVKQQVIDQINAAQLAKQAGAR